MKQSVYGENARTDREITEMEGRGNMSIIGLSIADKMLSCETEHIMEILLAKELRKNKNSDGKTDAARENLKIQNPAVLKAVSFLILSRETVQKSFACAEAIWAERPWLSIILVVRKPEEVFEALSYPFFHVVRGYALEQDLGAAIRKMERVRPPVQRWCPFLCKNGLVRVKQKDILYLESDRHEIRIHCVQETLTTAETLSQCENKLEGTGFVRIHKSFLVNFYHVVRIEKECLVMDNGERIWISRYRYPDVKRQFENYIRFLDFLD